MYSELIYTRCGEGVDILKGRSPVKYSGFKVYSCSENITDVGFTDLPFLDAIAQKTESYKEPDFMDDAYLFVVPDFGQRYLVDFHPIPFYTSTQENYSHRGGNFINQVFIGPFDDVYPFETFGNTAVWDAQQRSEAYYYENAPTPLVPRDSLNESVGEISFDSIAEFVADGRRDVLMSAVAFIVSQYSLPPEKRKFLVICDEDSRRIELWVAAIESAFSPRMASGLSFATRLDNFENNNHYTVNADGKYQTQIDFQDPNQKLRFRAMIVGVDGRDQKNTAAVKVQDYARYVVLDGKAKTLSVSVDVSDPYYQYVTSYNENHEFLCREFLQMVDVSSPSDDVLKLFSAFTSVSKYASSKKMEDLLPAVNILGRYTLIKTSALQGLYTQIKSELPRFLEEDAVSSFAVMNWVERAARVVGDDSVKESFDDTICHSYADSVFMRPGSDSTKKFHQALKESAFAQSAAEYLVSRATVDSYADVLRSYKPADWKAFTKFFAEALKSCRGDFPETVGILLPESVKVFYLARDDGGAVQTASMYAAQNREQTIEILLADASGASDQDYAEFLIWLACETAPEMTSSGNNFLHFYRQLQKWNLDWYFPYLLEDKAKNLLRVEDMEKFLGWVLSSGELRKVDLSPLVMELDKKIVLSDKTAGGLAAKIQSCRPRGVVCINSAHVFALDALDDKRQANRLIPLLNDMISQGFPSIEEETYADRLVGKLYSDKVSVDAFGTVVSAAANSPFYVGKIVGKAMRYMGMGKYYAIGDLMEVAADVNSKILSDAFVDACADLKQFEKKMSSVEDFLSSNNYSNAARRYFAYVEKKAAALHDQRVKPSFLDRLRDSFNSGKRSGK